ncbi:unnamed protein product, partial [Prorocentrum cordatum]
VPGSGDDAQPGPSGDASGEAGGAPADDQQPHKRRKTGKGKQISGDDSAATPQSKMVSTLLKDAKPIIAKYGLTMVAAHTTMNNIHSGRPEWTFMRDQPTRFEKLQTAMNKLSTEVQKTDGLDKLLTGKLADVKKVLGEAKFNAACVAAASIKPFIEAVGKADKIVNKEVQAREVSD